MCWMKRLEGPLVLEYIAFVDHYYFVARACQLKFAVFVALKVVVAFPIAVAVDLSEAEAVTLYAVVVAEVGSAEIGVASNPLMLAGHVVAAAVAELLPLFVVAYASVECLKHFQEAAAAADYVVAAVDLTYLPGNTFVAAGARA